MCQWLLSGLACAFSCGLLTTTCTAADRPNILFILSDDQRADTIAALGNVHIHTPHLDALVAAGTTFTHNYYMGGLNPAVCAPSRAMLMSGRTLFRIREDLAGIDTWPEQFGKNGYTTFITGKWHNERPSLLRSFEQGTAVFCGGMGDPYQLPLEDISAEHKLINQRISRQHSVQLFADAAIDFLGHQQGKQPFLCYVAFNCPHDPRHAPQSYHDAYNADKPPSPENFLPLHPFDNGEMLIRDEHLAPWPRTPAAIRQQLADYYSYITYMDDQIGRILDALHRNGQFEHTIIVFSSDNGLSIGSHGLMGKQNLYDESIRLPLIFVGKGIPANRRIAAFSYLIDIFPTLGELAGVPAPAGSEGLSQLGVIGHAQPAIRDSIFTAYRNIQRAVLDKRWELIQYTQINRTQLFDLQNDPFEIHDLVPAGRNTGDVTRLSELLRDWQQRLGDTQALTSRHPKSDVFDWSKVIRIPNATGLE
jgi:arylsulfatase A-like enzyme